MALENEQREDSFSFIVCTPGWTEDKKKVTFGAHDIIVTEYDLQNIEKHLRRFCQHCVGDNCIKITLTSRKSENESLKTIKYGTSFNLTGLTTENMSQNSNFTVDPNRQHERRVLLMAAISVGALMNLSIGTLVLYLKLPIYINAMGTLLIAVLLGIRASVCVGILSTLLTGLLVYPLEPYYVGTQIGLSIFAGFMARKGFFRTIPRAILSGVVLGWIAAILSAPITVYLFGGVPDLCCVSGITIFLLAKGYSIFWSVLGSYSVVEPVDKIVLCLIVFRLIRGLPDSLTRYFIGMGYLTKNIRKQSQR